MSADLIFSVPDSSVAARERCLQAIKQLGAPLKSDSGHFITGVISSGHNSIELRVTWLAAGTGTQITVTAAHEDLPDYELQNAAMRFRNEYMTRTQAGKKPRRGLNVGGLLVIVGAAAAVAMFVFALMHQSAH